jgi:SurA N-terminal domain
VERTPITKASFEHWMAITVALTRSKAHGPAERALLLNQVLGFLITSQWVLAEAAHRGIAVSDAEVRQRLHQLTAGQYATAAALQKYLSSVKETEADLSQRVKIELLQARISKAVAAGKTASAQVQAALNAFQRRFYSRWKHRTNCRPGYVMEDCSESPHAPKG